MEDGLYKAQFKTPLGEGSGVVDLRNGKVRGGDGMMYYVGTFGQAGGVFTADIKVDTHTNIPGESSVLGPRQARLHLTGTTTGNTATAKGSSPDAPGIAFSAVLTRLAD